MATVDNAVRLLRGTSRDLDLVMAVMESAFGDRYGEAWTRSQCAGILPMTGVTLTVARDSRSEALVGFALSRSVADESELLLLAVLPDEQRRGIGRALLDEFIEAARRDGASRVHLEVREGNPAIAMYRGAGFAPVGRRRKYYHGADGRHFDALTFARDL
jgi:ribosomal-protein-alanine N-acetyltransferase